MWYCWLTSIDLLIWNQYLRHCSCQSIAEGKLDQSAKLMSKNHYAACDVGVLESCVYLSTFLILALDGDDWSLAPSGQDMVIAMWIYSRPYWESNSSYVAGSLVTVYNYSGCSLITLLYSTLYCKGYSGSNASAKVSRTSGVTLKGNLSHIVVLELQFAVGYSLVNVVVCIVSCSKLITWVKTHQTASRYWVFDIWKYDTQLEFAVIYWLFMVKILCT
jgi:hypothetical protein